MLIPSIIVLFSSQLMLPQLTAALSPFQPERTDPSRQGYHIDGWTPKPTSLPEVFIIKERQSYGNQVCGVLRGNLDYSDYTYTCQASETCMLEGNWWGCCHQTAVPGCSQWQCPSLSSCVAYSQLSQCDKACQTNTNVLKCTNTVSPYCAVATAFSNTATGSGNDIPKIGQKFFACEPSQYNLNFTVGATTNLPIPCGPAWIANPTSLAAWSAANPSYAHSFGDPFRQLVARSSIKPTTSGSTLSTTGGSNKLSFPTTSSSKPTTVASGSTLPRTSTSTPSSISPITTTPVPNPNGGSRGAGTLIVPPHRIVICGFAVVLALVS